MYFEIGPKKLSSQIFIAIGERWLYSQLCKMRKTRAINENFLFFEIFQKTLCQIDPWVVAQNL